MRRGIVNMEVSFLETFTVISLRVAESEKSLLQKLILLVPESESDMLVAVTVTDASNAILTPSESSRSSLIMGEMTPGVTVMRIVFSDCSPLSFSSIATPLLPVLRALAILLQPLLFLTEVLVMIDDDHREA